MNISSSVTEEPPEPTVEAPQADPVSSDPTNTEPVTDPPPDTAVSEAPAVVVDDLNDHEPPEHDSSTTGSSDEVQDVVDAGENMNEPIATTVEVENATAEESVPCSASLADAQALPERQPSPSSSTSPTVEELQERLQLVERRFNGNYKTSLPFTV